MGPAGLVIPVVGVKVAQLSDTFTQDRAEAPGRTTRSTSGLRATVPRSSPRLPGRIEKLFDSKGGGGTTVYVRSVDGHWLYYYAHLDRYAPGLAEGQAVQRGTQLGTVGSTGNANPAGPHLHFAIHRMGRGEKWYDGIAVNPYPLLAGKRASG